MRIFVKLLILILIFGSFNPAFAENYTPTPEEEKVYQEYFDAYYEKLYQAFNPHEKLFIKEGVKHNMFNYILTRDGTVKDLRYDHDWTFYPFEVFFEKYGLSIIRNTKADPFPPEIKEDEIYVRVEFFYGYDKWYDYRHIEYHYNSKNCIIKPPFGKKYRYDGTLVFIEVQVYR